MDYHIAVIDIGKTNKKLHVYDAGLRLVHSRQAAFGEITVDGVGVEDIAGMTAWMWDALKEAAGQFAIKAVSVTTHGAMAVCVDKDGTSVVPAAAYTHEPGPDFHRAYYAEFGDPVELQQTTCTPDFPGLLTVGKGMYFRKKTWPAEFARTAHILNFPQYFGFLLTGRAAAEPTATGCHTHLWDFRRKRYSLVADKLGITPLLPRDMIDPWAVLGTLTPAAAARTGLDPACVVTAGIHDSNSSLLPYLIKGADDFVLNSTGTWCVAMRPERKIAFAPEELGTFVFYNLSALGTPVKTTIVAGGMEFDAWTAVLKARTPGFRFPAFDAARYGRIVKEKKLFVLPTAAAGTGMFPKSVPRVTSGGTAITLADLKTDPSRLPLAVADEDLYAALNLSLALHTQVGLSRAGAKDGTAVYIEGGFRKNDTYGRLLAARFPASRTALTGMAEATSFGAALLGKCAVEKRHPRDLRDAFDLAAEPVAPAAVPGLDAYAAAYLKAVTG